MKRITNAVGVLAAAAALVGCSALQIDIDVYKGPLINNDYVQQDQLISTAMAAKSLLYAARNRLLEEYSAGWSGKSPCEQADREMPLPERAGDSRSPCAVLYDGSGKGPVTALQQARRFNDLLCLFANVEGAAWATLRAPAAAPARPSPRNYPVCAARLNAGRGDLGIDALADIHLSSLRLWRENELRDEEVRAAQADMLQREVHISFDALRHALADAAARMQFLATNLFLVEGGSGSLDGMGVRGTMEAIANTILVHIDDLDRQRRFDEQQRASAERERRGASAALVPDAADAVRRVGEVFKRRVKAAEVVAGAAQAEDQRLAELQQQLALAERAQKEADSRSASAERMKLRGDALEPIVAGKVKDKPKAAAAGNKAPVGETDAQQQALEAELAQIGQDLDTALRKGDAVPTDEDLRALLAAGLVGKLADRVSEERRALASTAAMALALELLEGPLKPMSQEAPAEKTRSAALQRFKRSLLTYVEQLRGAAETAGKKAKAEADKVAQARAKVVDRKVAVSSEPLSLADLRALLTTINTVTPEVQALVKTHRTPSSDVLKTFTEELKSRAAKAAEAEKDGFKRAQQEIEKLSPELVLASADTALTGRDVLDELIAQYRFAWLEAVRKEGEASETAVRAKAALDRVRREREDMIYVRPASTYLRSALPITALQGASDAHWKNMLFESALRTPTSLLSKLFLKDEVRDAEAKLALDKAHWQNINAVRVSGAGSTNFAIAKDDVGNWYVKAMGADPGAMVRAATRLALFNAGGRFDANLLRADELRQQIDDKRRRNESATAEESELVQITQGQSGPAVAARADTLELFRQNYRKQSATHLQSLAAKLQADAPLVALRLRFEEAMEGTKDPKVLNSIVDSGLVKDRFAEAIQATEGDEADAKPGDAILKSLAKLNDTRVALTAQLQAHTQALEDPLAALARAKTAVADARALVDRLTKEEQDAADALQTAAESFRKAREGEGASEAEKKKTADELDDRRSTQAAKVKARRDAEAGLKNDIDRQAAAEAELAAMKARIGRATEHAETVFRKLVDDTIIERLRVVAETETAVKIIGTGAAGTGSGTK